MIGGNGIDGAILKRLSQGLDIDCGTQWWIHLGIRIIAPYRFVGQEQMMRRHLGRDA